MKAVVAIDSMKGSLSSLDAGRAAEEGIKRVYKDAEVFVKTLADGGEGTVQALADGMNGKLNTVRVTGPLGKCVDCTYAIVEDTKTAIVEMAGAAGITLISKEERNPFNATTYGVGEVIADAIKKGCRRFIIGIGGSATNDGGTGMLRALGYRFLDAYRKDIPLGAKGLEKLKSIDCEQVLPELQECKFYVACDVTNPLYGQDGCSTVYGPQKGADQEMVYKMDIWMKNYAHVCKETFGEADPMYPGVGAAGGMGFAFKIFTDAELKSGTEIVLKETGLEKIIKDADIVITGEGRLDGQTAMGKAPVGVARMAKKYNVPVIAVAGSVTKEAALCNENGIDAFFSILNNVVSLEEAMDCDTAKTNLANTVEQIFRVWRLGHIINYFEE